MLQDMVWPFLERTAPHHWLVAKLAEVAGGFAYAEPKHDRRHIQPSGITTDPEMQGRSVASALIALLENEQRGEGGRVLLVETSSIDQYGATRNFYHNRAFVEAACIRDFYADGKDKIVLWKQR